MDAVVDFFENHGITTIFGIIGSANSYLYDSFSKRSGFRIVNVHHEQAAVMAAIAHYRSSGKIAIALVTAGAGATNSITGIVSAWADSIPVIIITGQESSRYIREYAHRRMYGTQGVDIVHMVSKVTKFAKTSTISSLMDDLTCAYIASTSDRPGPVLIDIPFDVQSGKEQTSVNLKKIPIQKQKFTRPLVLAGHGVKLSKGAKDLFHKKIVHKIPFILSWSSIDLVSHDEDLYFGMPGIYGQRAANHIVQMCDLLIVLGSRLALPQTGYNTENYAKNAKIVVVDIDPTEDKPFVDEHIHEDCARFLETFEIDDASNEWINECKEIRSKFPIIERCHDSPMNSYRIINNMSKHMKQDAIIVTDMGTALLSGHQAIHLGPDNTMFTSYGLGEMGFGLPAAIGAAFACPDKQIVCLNCDGSMMMNLQELQTIKQHNLNVKIVVFNNDGYLMIKHTQKMLFGGKYTAVNSNTGITLPDYIEIGKAFGYKTYRLVDEWNSEFLDCDGPCICEIMMDPEQDFVPKLRGVLKNGVLTPPEFHELSPLPQHDE